MRACSCSRSTPCSASSSSTRSGRSLDGAGRVRGARRRARRAARARLALLRPRPRGDVPRERDLVARLARPRAGGDGRRLRAQRVRRRRQLPHRLPHRALAVARQPLRLHPAVRVLRRAARLPRPAAVLGHHRGARAARAGDPRRDRAHRAVSLRALRAGRAAARARLPDLPRRRRGRRPRPQHRRARGAPLLPGHRRVSRGALVRPRGRQAPRHADLPLPRRDRRRRHRVRRRLDPGRVRDHDRSAHHLGRQRLRAARPARAVRARRGPDQALPLPRRDDRRRARARRGEDPHRAADQDRAGGEPRACRGGLRRRHRRVADRRSPRPRGCREAQGGSRASPARRTPTRTRTSCNEPPATSSAR